MPSELIFEIHEGLPRQGVGLNEYTRRAYEMLPPLVEPRILDVGCGSGAPSLELARVSGGRVIGLDVYQPYLDELSRRAEAQALLEDSQREIDMLRRYPGWYSSVFFLMRKS